MLLVVLAQAQSAPVPPSNIQVSFERVHQERDRPRLNLEYPFPDKPVFRVEVRERVPMLEPLWKDTSGAPAYVRAPRPPVHHDFLDMVTPDEFRSAVLYPCCIPLMPLLEYLQDQVNGVVRSERESRAKRTVANELLKAGLPVIKR